jgi:drug/metabolite transporter (DMT)-like permease
MAIDWWPLREGTIDLDPTSLWIPLTMWAAFAQTLRNAAQRHLVADLGTLGATLVRFLYGLPFALAYFAIVLAVAGTGPPALAPPFLAWVAEAAFAQIVATALLLRVMAERNFTVGVAYSKTELVQVTLFGAVVLGDRVTPMTLVAVALATSSLLLLTPREPGRPITSWFSGWTSRVALLGLGSGSCFAVAAVGYRGAALSVPDAGYFMAAATALVWAQAFQVVMLGGWLMRRSPAVIGHVFLAWRRSMTAGFMGAAASAGWFSAMAMEPVAHVRTLGLVEVLFSYVLSRRLFRERLELTELLGIGLLILGLATIALSK